VKAQLLFYPETEQLFVFKEEDQVNKKSLKKVLTYVVMNTIYIL
jgi:hypothetical protein